MKQPYTVHNRKNLLFWAFFGLLMWVALLLPMCAHGQSQLLPYFDDPLGFAQADTVREMKISGDTLFVVESWSNGATWKQTVSPSGEMVYLDRVDRPAGRRRLVYKLKLLQVQKPCMVEHSETIPATVKTFVTEEWSNK